jgi:predicted ATPase
VFVGRTDQIAALDTLYAEVGEGAARTLVIDGEAGVHPVPSRVVAAVSQGRRPG